MYMSVLVHLKYIFMYVLCVYSTRVPQEKVCFCQFLLILFLPKFMINMTTLIFKLSISHF